MDFFHVYGQLYFLFAFGLGPWIHPCYQIVVTADDIELHLRAQRFDHFNDGIESIRNGESMNDDNCTLIEQSKAVCIDIAF